MTTEFVEKKITLSLSCKLKDALIAAGYRVHMTRNSDLFVSLEDRTAYVTRYPDTAAFISIHTNAAKNPTCSGIETYYLDNASIIRHESHLHEDDHKVLMLHRKNLSSASKKLANVVHDEIVAYAHNKYPVKDRKVRHSLGQVLFTSAPSVLIECGFLSNPQERDFLADDTYQEGFAQAIVRGLKKFL